MNYVIVPVAELNKLTLSNYHQTSWDTINADHTGQWCVLKFTGNKPAELDTLSSYQGPMENLAVLQIIDSETWRPIPEWMRATE